MTAAQTRSLVAQAIKRANSDSLEERLRYLELFAPDARLGGLWPAPDGVDLLRTVLTDLWSAYPDSRVDAEEIVVERNRVALRYRWHAGDDELWPTLAGTAFMRFSGGKVVECWQGVLADAA
jgi:hypothetical protein